MMEKKKKIISILCLINCLLLGLVYMPSVYAEESQESSQDVNDYFIALDHEGNVEQIPEEEVETPVEEELVELYKEQLELIEEGEIETEETNETSNISNASLFSVGAYTVPAITSDTSAACGVVIFKGTGTINYTNAKTGIAGYISASYSPDAAYLGLENGKVKFKMGGVVGLVSQNDVYVYDYDTYIGAKKITSRYSISGGKIYHNITTNLTSYASNNLVGYKQSYMSDNATYYSYDGHYFYKSYKDMIADYKEGTFKRSINPSNPYYNYYQYLSHRSKTNFTATQIDGYINAKTSSSSKLRNLGSSFIGHQNTYSVNGILMLGVAINESGWGNSSIAHNKNNLFGHGAVDSNPYYGANGYSSPADGIKYHAEIFVSNGYIDPVDWRYFGPHLGDKESGMNVKYASDPYWGEKAAAQCYLLEEHYSDKVYDYGTKTIGIVSGNIDIYKEASTTLSLYSTGNGNSTVKPTYDFPVLILDSTTNSTWFKIQTDGPLNSSRTNIASDTLYSMSRDYGYMKSTHIKLINSGNEDVPTYLKGDVNQDGQIAANDYMLIKNHILGRSKLTGVSLEIADVNKDGSIAANDYMLIKNHILGRGSLN